MTSWFRSWHGAPTDPKWRTVAKRAGVRPGDVTALVWALLDRASQAAERGSIAGYDAEVLADALGYETQEVEAILSALHEKGVLENDKFVGWEKHQPQREDNSSERVRAYRDRKAAEAKTETPTLEMKRTVTQCNAPDTDTDTDKNISYLSETSSDAQVLEFPELGKQAKPKRQRNAYSAAFEEFWQAYPTDPLMSKANAAKQFERLSDEDQRRAINAVPDFRAHCHKNPDYRPVHAERFISQRRFDGFARGSPEAIPFDPVAHQANLDRILGRTKANA